MTFFDFRYGILLDGKSDISSFIPGNRVFSENPGAAILQNRTVLQLVLFPLSFVGFTTAKVQMVMVW